MQPDFIREGLAGALALLVLLGPPGYLWLRAAGVGPRLLLAPAAGVCAVAPIAALAAMVVGFSTPVLLGTWVLVTGTPLLLRRGSPDAAEARSGWLLGIAALVALAPAAHVVPVGHEGGLYLARAMFDHDKVAIVDAIRRDGIPAVNPFYADAGRPVALNYYFGAHALAAEVGKLTGVRSWAADAAMTWFTSFAIFSLTAAFALSWGGRRAAILALVLCFAGSPAFILEDVLGPRMLRWTQQPGIDGMGPLVPQLMYAYQHGIAALALLLLLPLRNAPPGPPRIFLGAGAFAVAGTSSTWICVTFALASPLMLWADRRSLRWVLPALLLGALLAAPPLHAALQGDHLPERLAGLHVLPASQLSSKPVWQVPLYWLHYLPLEFGVAFIVGLLGLVKLREARPALALAVGSLVVAQFVRSSIQNNDLGWRAPLLALPLLNAAAATAAVRAAEWFRRPRALLAIWRVGLVIGVLSGIRILEVPDPAHSPPKDPGRHARFARQEEAWKLVRAHAGPEDLVQSDPFAFADMTRWPANIGWCLFADRRAAISDPDPSLTFSWRQDRATMLRVIDRVSRAFREPAPGDAAYLRDELHIRVLLVGRDDGAWPGDAFLDAYEVAHEDPDFRILKARP